MTRRVWSSALDVPLDPGLLVLELLRRLGEAAPRSGPP
jgi:hypothetical protein